MKLSVLCSGPLHLKKNLKVFFFKLNCNQSSINNNVVLGRKLSQYDQTHTGITSLPPLVHPGIS